ncbi:MAG: twin-arginine translocation signal domain-containing protein [Halanaeroarchaeum sp.]
MPSSTTRRRFLGKSTIGVAALLAGCSGPETTTESRSTTTTDGPENQTIAPATLSDETASERALTAEKEYLEGQLSGASCLDDWGTTATVVERETTVIERTADGVRVDVVHPYWYTRTLTDRETSIQEHSDAGSRATYLVTQNDEERLDGDDVSPC